MHIPISQLTGIPLDWAVATALGLPVMVEIPTPIDAGNGSAYQFKPRLKLHDKPMEGVPDFCLRICPAFSMSWEHAGPLIEQARLSVWVNGQEWLSAPEAWLTASTDLDNDAFDRMLPPQSGSTPLLAVMRCLVQIKLGNEVDIPDALLQDNGDMCSSHPYSGQNSDGFDRRCS